MTLRINHPNITFEQTNKQKQTYFIWAMGVLLTDANNMLIIVQKVWNMLIWQVDLFVAI